MGIYSSTKHHINLNVGSFNSQSTKFRDHKNLKML